MQNQTTESGRDALERTRSAVELSLDRAGNWPHWFARKGSQAARDSLRCLAGEIGLSLAYQRLHALGLFDPGSGGPARLARLVQGADLALAAAELHRQKEQAFELGLLQHGPEWPESDDGSTSLYVLAMSLQGFAGTVVSLYDAAIASPTLLLKDPSLFESPRWAWHNVASIDPHHCAWLEGLKAAATKAMGGAPSPEAVAPSVVESEDWKPAGFFPIKLRDRIRQAAQPKRVNMQVPKQKVGGVVLYYVPAVRQWWGTDMPK